ncbi:hypothetical protein HT576_21450 [Haloterrigena sp. SYSU A121-1]|uniref:Uncharacterized protein n=1 Tax=Haloterrigena gelatinilytica TaxID=2741724 RepID=A0A8J8GPG2_9EURY|nr:hypothetical protein [Haloterrigena gelatinilytica]NUB93556.1 hypothetical protein [Haloterrigena gelatinilytica]
MRPQAERWCHLSIGIASVLLTIGIGYDFIFGTKLADFLVIIAGLFIGWVAFLYCLGNASFWG